MVLKSCLIKDALCDFILMKYSYTGKQRGRGLPPPLTYLLSIPAGYYLGLPVCKVVLRPSYLGGGMWPIRCASYKFTNPLKHSGVNLPSSVECCDRTLPEIPPRAKILQLPEEPQGCGFFQAWAQPPPSTSACPHPTPHVPSPPRQLCLLLSLHLGADSWACFIKARKRPWFGAEPAQSP